MFTADIYRYRYTDIYNLEDINCFCLDILYFLKFHSFLCSIVGFQTFYLVMPVKGPIQYYIKVCLNLSALALLSMCTWYHCSELESTIHICKNLLKNCQK